MKRTHEASGRFSTAFWLASLLPGLAPAGAWAAEEDAKLARWLKAQEWKRDSDQPVLSLGEKGSFDDQHIFAPHVIHFNGEYWMYYSGSQRCVDAGVRSEERRGGQGCG